MTPASTGSGGNQTSGLGRSISYTSYNKPSSITQGSSTLFFSDDTDHQRFKQVSPQGTTLYFDAFGVHTELFVAATTQWYDFLTAGGSLIGLRVLHSDETVATRYFQSDNLGSIAVITDESGNVVERDSYDAWGKRRFPNGADDPSGSLTSQTTRGFTGQEELADVGLVHLNGRVYDPLIGRMMSADPFVPDPMNGQAWNRYSYVINNPLALTDTNGYCFLGMCSWGKAISTFFNRTIGAVFRAVPILGTLFDIAAAALCTFNPACAPFAAVVAGLSSSFVAGVTTGNLSYALKAGLIAGLTAEAMYVVGGVTNVLESGDPDSFFAAHVAPQLDTNPGAYAFQVAGHALVGCASAAASGGKCGAGALSGGITSAAAPFINGKDFATNVASNAVLGGLASMAGGGKFANGAITGAFGYLFNEMGNYQQRGYDPTMYSDGTVCNAGTASGCIMEGATPSAFLEDAALALTGIGTAMRAVAAVEDVAAATAEDALNGASSLYDTSITRVGSQYLNVQTDVGAQEFQQNLISNGYNVVNQTGGATVLSDGTNTWTIYTRTSTGMPGAQFFGGNGSIVKYSLGGP